MGACVPLFRQRPFDPGDERAAAMMAGWRSGAILHERSPCPRSPKAACAIQKRPPTTISALRSSHSVLRFQNPCPSEPLSRGRTTPAMLLTDSPLEPANGRKGFSGAFPGAGLACQPGNGRQTERPGTRETTAQWGPGDGTAPSTNCGENVAGKRLGSAGQTKGVSEHRVAL